MSQAKKDAAAAKLRKDVRDTYEQMSRQTIPYEEGIRRLGDISDEYRAVCRAEYRAAMFVWKRRLQTSPRK